MKKTLLALFFALCSAQLFAQKEAEEFPWSKAAKIIEADEAAEKAKVSSPKEAERKREARVRKPEKKVDAENSKSK